MAVEQPANVEKRLGEWLESHLATLGHDLVSYEVEQGRSPTLRLFIDKTEGDKHVDIEDCAKVSRGLDEPLDQEPLVLSVFPKGYELEVSSPGVNRPLRRAIDFNRYAGEYAHISTLRGLTGTEGSNPEFFTANPKQKNFFGILKGVEGETVRVHLIPNDGTLHQKTKPGQKKPAKAKKETPVTIPLSLIHKANLEREVVWPEEEKE